MLFMMLKKMSMVLGVLRICCITMYVTVLLFLMMTTFIYILRIRIRRGIMWISARCREAMVYTGFLMVK